MAVWLRSGAVGLERAGSPPRQSALRRQKSTGRADRRVRLGLMQKCM
jgi:hypothetical protein